MKVSGRVSAFDTLRVMAAGDLGPGPSEDILSSFHNAVPKRKNAPFRESACYTATADSTYYLYLGYSSSEEELEFTVVLSSWEKIQIPSTSCLLKKQLCLE